MGTDVSRSTVTVSIPAYNAREVLERAVGSVLSQTYPCHEIIIVDDGSSDGTQDLIADLAARHSIVKPVIRERNGGVSAARNLGFAHATGDWLAILDADDAWKPERIATLIEAAERVGADYVMDNMVLYDSIAKREHRRMIAPSWSVLPLTMERYFRNCRLGGPQYAILKPIVRRSFVERTGLRYDEECGNGQDLIYHGEALALGASAIVLAEPLYIYTTRVGGFSKRANSSSRTKMNFQGIADRIDALRLRHGSAIRGAADRQARLCRRSFMVGDRLNRYRDLRRGGKRVLGWAKLLSDPSGVLLTARMRYRRWMVQRPPYTLG
nr:glycosyltransferase [Sphingomonas corticis]